MEQVQHHPLRHEVRDARIRPIVLTAAALAVSAALVLAFSVVMYRYFIAYTATPVTNPLNGAERLVPPPRITDQPEMELGQLRQQENQVLSSYGWVNRNAGTIHIPIDRAMELQLQRGFPVRKEARKP
jgi:hypothetical protein